MARAFRRTDTMDCYVDLHIHSCLSPCGDALMTPNNIVKMAALKGLNMIAVCDHNTCRHLPAIEKVANEIGISLLPGIEITTREEVHLLGYFRTVLEAVSFSDAIYPRLPGIQNKPEFFGAQSELDSGDEPVREEPKLLISALDLSIDELTAMLRERGALAVPAHINRPGNGILDALGFLPPNLDFRVLEISKNLPIDPGYETYKHLHASDAHYIQDIFEREFRIPLSAPTPDAFFDWCLR